MYKTSLAYNKLLELLTYDQETGLLRWNTSGPGRKKSLIAGYLGTDGYVSVCIEGQLYKAHRLAWLYTTGKWPKEQLDHINGNRADNRLENLREADASSNQENLTKGHSDARVKSLGVTFHNGKYMSRIVSKGKTYHLGYYESEEAAARVYLSAKKEIHSMCNEDYEQANPAMVIDL